MARHMRRLVCDCSAVSQARFSSVLQQDLASLFDPIYECFLWDNSMTWRWLTVNDEPHKHHGLMAQGRLFVFYKHGTTINYGKAYRLVP